jgi:hypothetical protein
VKHLQEDRAVEYRELVSRAQQARLEPNGEHPQLLGRLRRDLRRIRRRDYFPPPEQELARQAVENLAGQPATTGTAGEPA